MLQLIYVFAFTVLAFLAVGNMIRNLMTLGMDAQRSSSRSPYRQRMMGVPHPELLDDQGNLVDEPFLVMRSINVDDARVQLDALYKSSPGATNDEE
ncbi:MAG: DUF2973 domain-containing protein [Leptolyngbyaceae cyanobacterium SM1_3_5]|nr:DUF2973 domain-containing protein [Leptolyngbyaceae cyanobacterium SM1_3_5]